MNKSHKGPQLTIVRATKKQPRVTVKIYACCGYFVDTEKECLDCKWNSHTHSGELVMLRFKKRDKRKASSSMGLL